jgi:hypothetical protein
LRSCAIIQNGTTCSRWSRSPTPTNTPTSVRQNATQASSNGAETPPAEMLGGSFCHRASVHSARAHERRRRSLARRRERACAVYIAISPATLNAQPPQKAKRRVCRARPSEVERSDLQGASAVYVEPDRARLNAPTCKVQAPCISDRSDRDERSDLQSASAVYIRLIVKYGTHLLENY